MSAAMKKSKRVMLLSTAIIAVTPIECLAQASPPENQPTPSAPAETAPKEPVFLDANGDPFPPEFQRQLREQFKNQRPIIKTGAQGATKPSATPDSKGDIVVTAQKPRGSVVGDTAPERILSPLDITAYGATNVKELIQSMGPQLGSNGGDNAKGPITLLNGRRVSGFAEIAEIPSEAIERMEVFPEHLAIQYGYPADQKVVNIVTFEKFRSVLGQLGYVAATEGGYDSINAQTNFFAIRGNTRFDFGGEYSRSSRLLESDRDLVPLNSMLDDGEFRTLLPSTERLALNGLVGGQFVDNISSTFSGNFTTTTFKSLLGQTNSGLLAQDNIARNTNVGTSHHGKIGKWLWTFTGSYDHVRTKLLTDYSAGLNERATSNSATISANLLLSGALFNLPAGPLTASARSTIERRDYDSDTFFQGANRQVDLSRDSAALQINLNMPVTGPRAESPAWLGTASINANAELRQLSGFGSLRTLGTGLNWSPSPEISFSASFSAEQHAPTMEQLGAPLIETPNVRVFDPVRYELVDAVQVFGGNQQLRADDRQNIRLGLNIRPFKATDFSLSVDYLSTRIDDPIFRFPLLSPELAAAFPERFVRDSDGRLVQYDSRPLNFEESRQQQIRWGINFMRPLGKVEPWLRNAQVRTYANEADVRAAAGPNAMVTMVQPNSALARRFENMASRFYVSLYHSWRLQDELVLRSGEQGLDLLDNAAIDPQRGARRHALELQAGIFKKGLGARATVNWKSGATLHNFGPNGDLKFSDLTTFNLNFFVNLADHFNSAKAPKWLKGMRASLNISNLFNARLKATDQAGTTPFNYQSAYMEPLGRHIGFSLRKVF